MTRSRINRNAGMAGVLITLLISTLCQAAGSVVYCDARAPGANNGSDWANAYVCLQDAIKKAGLGSEIRVAQGTYTPDQYFAIRRDGDRVVASGDRTASFVLPTGVTLKGGYAGYGAVNPNQRDILTHASILSGDLAHNDVPLQGHDWQSLANFVLDKSRSDNSQSVVTVSEGGVPVLDGFVVTAGHAGVLSGAKGRGDASTAAPDLDGAGVYITAGAPQFVRCTFQFNTTRAGESGAAGGAGVLCMNASPVFTECTFQENIAFAAAGISIGGAMRNINSNPVLTDCFFVGNVAAGSDGQYRGGAIANYRSNPTINGCLFSANMAVRSHGGAIFDSNTSNPTLTDCVFNTNLADCGGAICNADDSSPTMTRCAFSSNQASYGHGGAIYNGSGCTSVATACQFVGNMAADEGGALSGTGQPAFVNCLFTANVATKGAAIFVEPSGDVGLANCTLVANLATESGGAIYGQGSTIRATNCILWSDTPQEVYLENGTAEITHSDIQGTWDGQGNIHSDPKFLDPVGADNVQGTADDDLRLSMGSPCLDVGDNSAIGQSVTTDLAGKVRVANEHVDMGAYEFNGPFCYYVDAATGSDLNGGWTPKEAFATIQKGIDTAREGYTVAVAP
ncbi:MAG: choice-of-anchor Q domain-containing protein, partial [Solirubrobacterales bacterium]